MPKCDATTGETRRHFGKAPGIFPNRKEHPLIKQEIPFVSFETPIGKIEKKKQELRKKGNELARTIEEKLKGLFARVELIEEEREQKLIRAGEDQLEAQTPPAVELRDACKLERNSLRWPHKCPSRPP